MASGLALAFEPSCPGRDHDEGAILTPIHRPAWGSSTRVWRTTTVSVPSNSNELQPEAAEGE